MSLKSWKKEFYPTKPPTSSWLKATEHSLRKWEGATKSNLKKHDLFWNGDGVQEKNDTEFDFYSPSFQFDDYTCALCQRADKLIEKIQDRNRCEVCPLVAVQGGVDCTDMDSPFDAFYNTGNPTRMIAALRRLHKKLSKTK